MGVGYRIVDTRRIGRDKRKEGEALDGYAGDASARVVFVTGAAPGYFIGHFSVPWLVRLEEFLRLFKPTV
jgi:hypothetical protein